MNVNIYGLTVQVYIYICLSLPGFFLYISRYSNTKIIYICHGNGLYIFIRSNQTPLCMQYTFAPGMPRNTRRKISLVMGLKKQINHWRKQRQRQRQSLSLKNQLRIFRSLQSRDDVGSDPLYIVLKVGFVGSRCMLAQDRPYNE